MILRFSLFILLLTMSLANAAMGQGASPPTGSPPAAQTTPPQEPQPSAEQPPGRVFCDQNVIYHLASADAVPEQYRRFLGVWSDASWDPKTCAALIVQDVKSDGAASIIYVYGPEGSSSTVPGAVLHGIGIIRDDELRFQNNDGSQYAFRPGLVDMSGHWINPKGESYQATFKATP
jgi:hypothetical protein